MSSKTMRIKGVRQYSSPFGLSVHIFQLSSTVFDILETSQSSFAVLAALAIAMDEVAEHFKVKLCLSVNGVLLHAEPQAVMDLERGALYCINLTSRTSKHIRFFEQVLGLPVNKNHFRKMDWKVLKEIKEALKEYRKKEMVRTPRSDHNVVKLRIRRADIWILNTLQHVTFCFENDSNGFDSLAWLLECFEDQIRNPQAPSAVSSPSDPIEKRVREEENAQIEAELNEAFMEKYLAHPLKPQINWMPSRNSFRFVVPHLKKKYIRNVRVKDLQKARDSDDPRDLEKAFAKASESAEDNLVGISNDIVMDRERENGQRI